MVRWLKGYKIILWVVLALVTIPLLLASMYCRPVADDLDALVFLDKNAASTRTVFDAIKLAINRAAESWNTITGTFGSSIIYALFWYFFGESLVHVAPIALLLVLILSCFLAARCLKTVKNDISSDAVACIALLLAIMSMLLMPSASDGFYWVTGASYVLSYSVAVCLFSSLFRRCWLEKKASVWDGLYLLAMCVAFFMMGGGDHLNATFAVTLYGFFTLAMLLCRKPKRYLLPFLFLIAGYLLAVLAPGNTIRQGIVGSSTPIPTALVLSFFKALQFAFSDARYYVFLALFLPLAIEVSATLSVSPKQALCTALASFALLAATIFPMVMTNVIPVGRHNNRFFVELCMLLPLNLVTGVSCLRQRFTPNAAEAPSPRSASVKRTLAMCVVAVSFCVLCLPNIQTAPLRLNCNVPSVKAVSYLRDGQLRRYAGVFDEIAAELESNPNQRLIVSTVPWNYLLGSTGISEDSEYFANQVFAHYFGGPDSVIVYQPE